MTFDREKYHMKFKIGEGGTNVVCTAPMVSAVMELSVIVSELALDEYHILRMRVEDLSVSNDQLRFLKAADHHVQ